MAGLPPKLIEHARDLLRRSGVSVIHGVNVKAVEPNRLMLEDGTVLPAEVIAWCAGLEAPGIVRDLPVRHGKGGRIGVEPTLQVPEHPSVFAVGDVIEFQDPSTGLLVPGTAQAALAEARLVARNLVAQRSGAPLERFEDPGAGGDRLRRAWTRSRFAAPRQPLGEPRSPPEATGGPGLCEKRRGRGRPLGPRLIRAGANPFIGPFVRPGAHEGHCARWRVWNEAPPDHL